MNHHQKNIKDWTYIRDNFDMYVLNISSNGEVTGTIMDNYSFDLDNPFSFIMPKRWHNPNKPLEPQVKRFIEYQIEIATLKLL